MTHRLIALLTLAVAFVPAESVLARDVFPAPLPGENTVPPGSRSSSRAILGAKPLGSLPPTVAPGSETCANAFLPIRDDAEKKGKLIREAGERHAAPVEACKLIGDYSEAELKMIRYVEANSSRCGIPAQVGDQLKAGHKATTELLTRVCATAARISGQRPAFEGPAQINDFGDPVLGRAPRF